MRICASPGVYIVWIKGLFYDLIPNIRAILLHVSPMTRARIYADIIILHNDARRDDVFAYIMI